MKFEYIEAGGEGGVEQEEILGIMHGKLVEYGKIGELCKANREDEEIAEGGVNLQTKTLLMLN